MSGQGALVNTVPVGLGQLYLVGHMPLNLFYTGRQKKPHHLITSVDMYEYRLMNKKLYVGQT